MNVVKCKNGHFFDGDAYEKCPHCGEVVGMGCSTQVSSSEKSEKKRFAWGKKDASSVTNGDHPTEGMWNRGRTPTDVLKKGANTNPVPHMAQQAGEDKTLDFWQTAEHSNDNDSVCATNSAVAVASKPADAKWLPTEECIQKKEISAVESPKEEEEQKKALREAVKKVSANSVGKTMSYFNAVTSPENKNNAAQIVSDPVVGWLVCVGGKHFGQSFIIGAGKNSIGRNDDNKIVLFLDNTVSRTKHAFITYEPKKRNFYLQPGDSSGLTYLNDEYIEESKRLHMRDIIDLGESKFVFVPLCDETFTWEEYMHKE